MTLDAANFRALNEGLGQMVDDRVAAGWKPTLLTFMFNPLGGSPSSVAWQMQNEVESVYARVLTRIVRKPHSMPTNRLPFWICTPDYPVFKYEKDHFRDVSINDGRHIHVVAVTPLFSRMKETLEDHFYYEQGHYSGRDKLLSRIHAKTMTEEFGYATGYAAKGIKTSRIHSDELFILPRLSSEMST